MVVLVAGTVGTFAAVAPASATLSVRGTKAAAVFHATTEVADTAAFHPNLVDGDLTNAWGLAFFPGGPLWVSDNNSGDASAYAGGISGGPVSLQLTVPVPGGNPTGQVYNSFGMFPTGGAGGPSALFIVATDSIGAAQSPGEIAAWDGGTSFVVEDSPTGGPGGTTPTGAVFKGLAIAATAAGPELFATDVANAKVDVFNDAFAPMSTPTEFVDPSIPSGFTPFGIEVLKNDVYVTYGMQNGTKTDVVPGAGLGFVDVFTVNGTLVKHLVAGGPTSPLDEPWGLALAPKHFGHVSGKLLVGNLGNGVINVFNPKNGKFMGAVMSGAGQPIMIDRLWALKAGTSTFGGVRSVVFSSGPNAYADGTLGVLSPGP
jgi:uncharacterized protein (TIGR03118 family)